MRPPLCKLPQCAPCRILAVHCASSRCFRCGCMQIDHARSVLARLSVMGMVVGAAAGAGVWLARDALVHIFTRDPAVVAQVLAGRALGGNAAAALHARHGTPAGLWPRTTTSIHMKLALSRWPCTRGRRPQSPQVKSRSNTAHHLTCFGLWLARPCRLCACTPHACLFHERVCVPPPLPLMPACSRPDLT